MTNTYQASIGGFVQYLNMTPEDSLELIKNAVNLAKTACDQFMEEYPDPGNCQVISFKKIPILNIGHFCR